MFNRDEGKMECAVGNREMGVWQGKKTEIALISFLTSWFAVFICLWLLVLGLKNYKRMIIENNEIFYLCPFFDISVLSIWSLGYVLLGFLYLFSSLGIKLFDI